MRIAATSIRSRVNAEDNPERLIAQFQQFAGDADRNAAHETKAEARILARQNGLQRADQRLLDAYQAEVISLEELTERRQQLAEQCRALDHQREQQRGLRRQRTKAQEVLTDLTPPGGPIRPRCRPAREATPS